MSLINHITGELLIKLSSSSGGGSAKGSSSINGLGSGATFDGDSVDLKSGLATGSQTFARSFLRLSDGVSLVRGTEQTLGRLIEITDSLLDLAKSASSEDAKQVDRGRLNSKYQSLVRELSDVVSGASNDGTDLLDKSDVGGFLQDAGVDLNVSSRVSEMFKRIGGSDGKLGSEPIASEPLEVVIAGESTIQPPAGTNPLNQDLSTHSGALIALDTLSKFREEIGNDIDGVRQIANELESALAFALAGTRAFENIGSTNNSNIVAEELVNTIKSATSDSAIAAHSDLDTILARELLS